MGTYCRDERNKVKKGGSLYQEEEEQDCFKPFR